jgi:hypothetical protein
MRKRTINPDFFTDTKTGRLSALSQVLFIGMWCLSDREGYIEDDIDYIKVQILPYSKSSIKNNLEELVEKRIVIRCNYKGENLLNILNFKKHQPIHPHEAKSPYPPIDSEDVIKCNDITLPPNDNGRGNGKSKSLPFEDFYKLYPIKKSKAEAERKWKYLSQDIQSKCIDVLKSTEYKNWLAEQDIKFVKHPSTWLNQGCWEDELSSKKPKLTPSNYMMEDSNV